MARELKITESYNPRLYLYDSDTGANCIDEKVTDVTEDCPRRASNVYRCIFLYTRTKRGRIIQMTQIMQAHEGEKCGRHIHFFMDELEREMRVAPRDDTFGSWASRLGLSKPELHSLIEANAPAA